MTRNSPSSHTWKEGFNIQSPVSIATFAQGAGGQRGNLWVAPDSRLHSGRGHGWWMAISPKERKVCKEGWQSLRPLFLTNVHNPASAVTLKEEQAQWWIFQASKKRVQGQKTPLFIRRGLLACSYLLPALVPSRMLVSTFVLKQSFRKCRSVHTREYAQPHILHWAFLYGTEQGQQGLFMVPCLRGNWEWETWVFHKC